MKNIIKLILCVLVPVAVHGQGWYYQSVESSYVGNEQPGDWSGSDSFLDSLALATVFSDGQAVGYFDFPGVPDDFGDFPGVVLVSQPSGGWAWLGGDGEGGTAGDLSAGGLALGDIVSDSNFQSMLSAAGGTPGDIALPESSTSFFLLMGVAALTLPVCWAPRQRMLGAASCRGCVEL